MHYVFIRGKFFHSTSNSKNLYNSNCVCLVDLIRCSQHIHVEAQAIITPCNQKWHQFPGNGSVSLFFLSGFYFISFTFYGWTWLSVYILYRKPSSSMNVCFIWPHFSFVRLYKWESFTKNYTETLNFTSTRFKVFFFYISYKYS